MTTIALKKYLISKINLLEDDTVLKQLKKIVQNNEKVYVLSDIQLEKLKIAEEQLVNGQFVTQDEMDIKFEKWLIEK
jgi:hypothetical protein